MNTVRSSRPVRAGARPACRSSGYPSSRSSCRPPRAQRGVALAISLVLLVAMTVLGIATLAGTRLNEKVTSNAQQKSVAFEVAESAIDTVWSPLALLDSAASIPASDFETPAAIAPDGVAETLSSQFNQTRDSRSTLKVDGAVTIRFCGESPLPDGSSLDADESNGGMVGALFDVEGTAEIGNSATRSEHVQRGSLVRPRTGRGGGCVPPGT